ncbi:LysR family transcriptional regulator [Stappia sp. 22II-S9-Z10]|nr:LysR family transcriptional regulator [Stappia sp. 22II-S9-Z10]
MISMAAARAFSAVVEFGSFTTAAADLGISQPAVSERIRRIEMAVGGPVVSRPRIGCSVATALGRDLLTRVVTPMLDAEDNFRRMTAHGALETVQ